MTIEDITNFCEFKDCAVSLSHPEAGSIRIDGNGVQAKYNNYRRYLQFNELSALPPPGEVLEKANRFTIHRASGDQSLTREEFLKELETFQRKINV
ncbi:MAG: hypothetical protein ACRD1R_18335 [Acidobacteriota bacterium]